MKNGQTKQIYMWVCIYVCLYIFLYICTLVPHSLKLRHIAKSTKTSSCSIVKHVFYLVFQFSILLFRFSYLQLAMPTILAFSSLVLQQRSSTDSSLTLRIRNIPSKAAAAKIDQISQHTHTLDLYSCCKLNFTH